MKRTIRRHNSVPWMTSRLRRLEHRVKDISNVTTFTEANHRTKRMIQRRIKNLNKRITALKPK